MSHCGLSENDFAKLIDAVVMRSISVGEWSGQHQDEYDKRESKMASAVVELMNAIHSLYEDRDHLAEESHQLAEEANAQ